jgi:hypothetical protein
VFRDPNDDGLNESQPAGCIPDFEDVDDIPCGDLEPGIAEANLAILEQQFEAECDRAGE